MINRSQLDRIWKLACEGFGKDAHVSVATNRDTGIVSSKISGTSIDAIIQGVRQATLPGDPNYIDNLRLFVSDIYRDFESGRSVDISISTDQVHVAVSGADPGWVRGRIESLKDLFAETRRKWSFGNSDMNFFGVLAGCVLSVVPAVAILSAVNNDDFGTEILVLLSVMGAFVGTGFLLGRWIDKRTKIKLVLFDGPNPRQAVDKVALATLIATIVGVVIAALAILISHHDSTNGQSTGLPSAFILRND